MCCVFGGPTHVALLSNIRGRALASVVSLQISANTLVLTGLLDTVIYICHGETQGIGVILSSGFILYE